VHSRILFYGGQEVVIQYDAIIKCIVMINVALSRSVILNTY